MAKKRRRIEQATEGAQKRLTDWLSRLDPFYKSTAFNLGNDLLDSIGTTGDLPQDVRELFLKRGDTNLLSEFDGIKAELPSSKDALNTFIEKTKDEASLSDPVLQERLEAFQDPLISTGKPNFNWSNLESKINKLFEDEGYAKGNRIRGIIDYLHSKGGSEAEKSGEIKLDKIPGAISDKMRNQIFSWYGEEKALAVAPTSKDEDIKRIQDIQTGRAAKVSRTGELESFITGGEAESEAFAKDFLERQQTRGADVLSQELAPDVAQQLQKRGLLDSGEFGATISNLASQIQGGIESEYIQQRESDIAFWADLGFKAKFQELIDANKEVSGQIASERQTIRQGQQQSYQRRESDIQSKFNIDLFRRENERALRDYQTRTTRQQQKQRDQAQSQQIANIAQTGVQAIGTGFLLKGLG